MGPAGAPAAPQRPRTGRPAKDHRLVLNGILWVLRTGTPWRDLPDRYGPWRTGSSRFRRWREAGVGDQVVTALQTEAAHEGTLDDTLAMIDGTSRRAHQQAAVVLGRPTSAGPLWGCWGSKLHLITERQGKPLVVTLTAGQRPASPEAIPRREQLTERLWPDAVTGDKGYSRAAIRNWLLHWEIEAVLPYRQGERGPHESDRALDRERPVIERTINRLTPFRRIATRSEKLASTYLAMVAFAMILEWL